MSDFLLDDTVKHAGPTRLRLPTFELVVVAGPARGATLRLDRGTTTVGSGAGCQLRLADPAVSRVHLALEVGAAGLAVRDLGSTNGTWIGDTRVRDADIAAGCVLRLGASAIRVDPAEEPTFLALSEQTRFGELLGGSVAMRQVHAVLERVAPTDTTLLVEGETGTGKDVVARSVHAASPRARGPFVAVDCGAIPENLFESELFGHVRGAFTGAAQARTGAFEEANGGTLFLDEIGEMPLALQAKLLRAIESRRIRRVGASQETPIDVRLVCATNRRLARMVNEGTFREDLYYRLAVVEVVLPPLRERREDIPALAEAIYAQLRARRGVPADAPATLPAAVLEPLRERSFPGNVRELRNTLERLVTLGLAQREPAVGPVAGGGSVLPEGIESLVPLHLPLKEARDVWTSEFENVYVRAMLQRTDGNLTRAAELAGVSRRFLQRTIARLGLRATDDEDDDAG